MTGPEIPRTNVLGVGVSAVNMPLVLDTIDSWIDQGAHQYVCVRDVHGVMESQRDDSLGRIHSEAGLVTPDGMPLVWLSRLGGHKHVCRVYGPDLMLAECERSAEVGHRHFLYGGAPGVADTLKERLEQRYPGLQVVGTYSPPYRELTLEEDERVVRMLNQSGADIIWVGLGSPKQERWMAAHVGRLSAAVMVGVGAAFDFHAGAKRQAPKWMQRSGLEWLFRLVSEPRRLWRRYLVDNPLFCWLLALQALGLRRWNLPAPVEQAHADAE